MRGVRSRSVQELPTSEGEVWHNDDGAAIQILSVNKDTVWFEVLGCAAADRTHSVASWKGFKSMAAHFELRR